MIELMKLQRSRCSILPLVLKGKWFDMIARGEKREEYRLPTIYWRKRLHNWDCKFTENTSPIVEFRRGYAKDAPRMAFWCRSIETVSGLRPYAYVEFPADRCLHPEWGEPTDPHFFIQLGGRVELTNSENVVASLHKGAKKTITEYAPDKPKQIETIKKYPRAVKPGENEGG